MSRYSPEFNEQMVRKMMPPNNNGDIENNNGDIHYLDKPTRAGRGRCMGLLRR